jgi:adenosine deaminase
MQTSSPEMDAVIEDRASSTTRSLVRRLPKAELHIHLEGSIQAQRLESLARRHRVALPFDPWALGSRKVYADLGEFLDVFAVVCGLLRTPEDFEAVVVDLGEDAARQNIVYREVMFTPTYYMSNGPSLRGIVAALESGRARCMSQYGVLVNFIADIDRGTDPSVALELVHRLAEMNASEFVRAIGMDGAERDTPPGRLRQALHAALAFGFRVTSHIGSDEGPAAIRQALTELPLERIDHGIRCIEDPALLAHIAERRYPMTVCPLSNVAVDPGRYPDLAAHPLRRLLDAGARVTLNSDDPGMFAGDLIENFERCADEFGLTHEEIDRMARTAFEACFARPSDRNALLERFDRESQALRATLC